MFGMVHSFGNTFVWAAQKRQTGQCGAQTQHVNWPTDTLVWGWGHSLVSSEITYRDIRTHLCTISYDDLIRW
jgi:hypothetical protein